MAILLAAIDSPHTAARFNGAISFYWLGIFSLLFSLFRNWSPLGPLRRVARYALCLGVLISFCRPTWLDTYAVDSLEPVIAAAKGLWTRGRVQNHDGTLLLGFLPVNGIYESLLHLLFGNLHGSGLPREHYALQSMANVSALVLVALFLCVIHQARGTTGAAPVPDAASTAGEIRPEPSVKTSLGANGPEASPVQPVEPCARPKEGPLETSTESEATTNEPFRPNSPTETSAIPIIDRAARSSKYSTPSMGGRDGPVEGHRSHSMQTSNQTASVGVTAYTNSSSPSAVELQQLDEATTSSAHQQQQAHAVQQKIRSQRSWAEIRERHYGNPAKNRAAAMTPGQRLREARSAAPQLPVKQSFDREAFRARLKQKVEATRESARGRAREAYLRREAQRAASCKGEAGLQQGNTCKKHDFTEIQAWEILDAHPQGKNKHRRASKQARPKREQSPILQRELKSIASIRKPSQRMGAKPQARTRRPHRAASRREKQIAMAMQTDSYNLCKPQRNTREQLPGDSPAGLAKQAAPNAESEGLNTTATIVSEVTPTVLQRLVPREPAGLLDDTHDSDVEDQDNRSSRSERDPEPDSDDLDSLIAALVKWRPSLSNHDGPKLNRTSEEPGTNDAVRNDPRSNDQQSHEPEPSEPEPRKPESSKPRSREHGGDVDMGDEPAIDGSQGNDAAPNAPAADVKSSSKADEPDAMDAVPTGKAAPAPEEMDAEPTGKVTPAPEAMDAEPTGKAAPASDQSDIDMGNAQPTQGSLNGPQPRGNTNPFSTPPALPVYSKVPKAPGNGHRLFWPQPKRHFPAPAPQAPQPVLSPSQPPSSPAEAQPQPPASAPSAQPKFESAWLPWQLQTFLSPQFNFNSTIQQIWQINKATTTPTDRLRIVLELNREKPRPLGLPKLVQWLGLDELYKKELNRVWMAALEKDRKRAWKCGDFLEMWGPWLHG